MKLLVCLLVVMTASCSAILYGTTNGNDAESPVHTVRLVHGGSESAAQTESGVYDSSSVAYDPVLTLRLIHGSATGVSEYSVNAADSPVQTANVIHQQTGALTDNGDFSNSGNVESDIRTFKVIHDNGAVALDDVQNHAGIANSVGSGDAGGIVNTIRLIQQAASAGVLGTSSISGVSDSDNGNAGSIPFIQQNGGLAVLGGNGNIDALAGGGGSVRTIRIIPESVSNEGFSGGNSVSGSQGFAGGNIRTVRVIQQDLSHGGLSSGNSLSDSQGAAGSYGGFTSGYSLSGSQGVIGGNVKTIRFTLSGDNTVSESQGGAGSYGDFSGGNSLSGSQSYTDNHARIFRVIPLGVRNGGFSERNTLNRGQGIAGGNVRTLRVIKQSNGAAVLGNSGNHGFIADFGATNEAVGVGRTIRLIQQAVNDGAVVTRDSLQGNEGYESRLTGPTNNIRTTRVIKQRGGRGGLGSNGVASGNLGGLDFIGGNDRKIRVLQQAGGTAYLAGRGGLVGNSAAGRRVRIIKVIRQAPAVGGVNSINIIHDHAGHNKNK